MGRLNANVGYLSFLPISLCTLSAGDGRRRYDRRDLPSAASALRSKKFETLRRCLHHLRQRDDGDLHNVVHA